MDIDEIVGTEPESPKVENTIYELFKWSLLIKGTISLGEIIVGCITLLLPPGLVLAFVDTLRAYFPGDVHDFILTHVLAELDKFTQATVLFVSLYLLARGITKLFLVWNLLRGRLWAYPASLVTLGLFMIFQLYQIVTGGSIFIIFITLFDAIVVYLIWREYRIVLRHRAEKAR